MIISDMLATTLVRDGEAGRQLYCWETDGVRWLSEQWKRDPGTVINAWTADLVRDFEAGVPLVAGARPGSVTQGNPGFSHREPG